MRMTGKMWSHKCLTNVADAFESEKTKTMKESRDFPDFDRDFPDFDRDFPDDYSDCFVFQMRTESFRTSYGYIFRYQNHSLRLFLF